MTIDSVKAAVMNASNQWIEAFNRGDLVFCSEKYSAMAEMDARPMGHYTGRKEIYDFWQNFVDSTGATQLKYAEIEIEVIDNSNAKLSAKWTMNVGKGFISKELWSLQSGIWLLTEDDFTVEEKY
jgi:hypothetical protein